MPLFFEKELQALRRIAAAVMIIGTLAVAPAKAEWKEPRIHVDDIPVRFSEDAPLRGQEKLVEDVFRQFLVDKVFKRYRCASVFSDEDMRQWLKFNRTQQLLGTSEKKTAQLQDLANALGQDLVVITGHIRGTADGHEIYVVAVGAKGPIDSSRNVIRHRFPLQEKHLGPHLESLAEEVVKNLKLGFCTWDGTITLKIRGNDQENETESHENGSALISVQQAGELTIEVTLKGETEKQEESQTAKYTFSFERKERNTQNLIIKGCLTDDGKFVDKPYHSMHLSTCSASKSANLEGRPASITLNPKTHEYEIRVDIPNVDGETAVTREEKEEGGCPGVSNQSNDSYKNPTILINAQSFAVKDYLNSRDGRLKGEKKLEDVALFPYTNKPNEGSIRYDLKRR